MMSLLLNMLNSKSKLKKPSSVQSAFTYIELTKKSKIGIINLGVGNVEIMAKPLEWMKSAKSIERRERITLDT